MNYPPSQKKSYSVTIPLRWNLETYTRIEDLGRLTEQWGDLLVYLTTSKQVLDIITNRERENSLKTTEYPTLQNLIDFLEQRCHTLEIVQKKAQPVNTPSKYE